MGFSFCERAEKFIIIFLSYGKRVILLGGSFSMQKNVCLLRGASKLSILSLKHRRKKVMWKEYNANPVARRGDDCTVRAISMLMMKSWEDVYLELCLYGLRFYDMPSSNHVWGAYLIDNGYTRHIIPDTCPSCYTVAHFAQDHPEGSYVLALHGHVVAVKDGDYFDTWDSGDEVPLYYWKKGE